MNSLQKRIRNLEERTTCETKNVDLNIIFVDAATGEKDGPYQYNNGRLTPVPSKTGEAEPQAG